MTMGFAECTVLLYALCLGSGDETADMGSYRLLQRAEALLSDVEDPAAQARVRMLIANELFASGRVDDARGHYNELMAATQSPFTQNENRDNAIKFVAIARSEGGDLPGAVNNALAIGDMTIRDAALSLIASTAIERGEASQAVEIEKLIANQRARAQLRAELATMHEAKGDFHKADKLLVSIDTNYGKDVALLIAVETAIEAKNCQRAVELANRIASQSFKGRAFLEIAAAEAVAQNGSKAREFWTQGIDLLEPGIATERNSRYAIFQAQLGDFDGALESVDKIADAPAKDRTLRKIVAVMTSSGRTEDVANLLHRIEDGWAKDESIRDVAAALAESNQLSKAAALAEEIASPYIRSAAFLQISRAVSDSDNGDASRRFLERALASARTIEPGGGTKVIALADIAATQAKLQLQNQAQETIGEAIEATKPYDNELYRGELIQELLCKLAHNLPADQLEAWADKQRRATPRSLALLGIAKGIRERRSE